MTKSHGPEDCTQKFTHILQKSNNAIPTVFGLINAFTTGNPFWGQSYLDLVQGGVAGH